MKEKIIDWLEEYYCYYVMALWIGIGLTMCYAHFFN